MCWRVTIVGTQVRHIQNSNAEKPKKAATSYCSFQVAKVFGMQLSPVMMNQNMESIYSTVILIDKIVFNAVRDIFEYKVSYNH